MIRFILPLVFVALSFPALAQNANFADVDPSGNVVNIIVCPAAGCALPNGHQAIAVGTGAAIGGTYSGGVFTPPASPPPPPAAPTCNITSTGTPGETGNYAIPDGPTMTEIASASLYTEINPGKFPGGVTSFAWPDASGSPHSFASSAAWLAWATAMADCVAAYANGGTSFAETIP